MCNETRNTTAADDFGTAVMNAVARRIARQAQTDPAEAVKDFNQHVRDMSADERADFEKAIVEAAIELAA